MKPKTILGRLFYKTKENKNEEEKSYTGKIAVQDERKTMDEKLDKIYFDLGYSKDPVKIVKVSNEIDSNNQMLRKDFNLEETDIMIIVKALTNSAAHHRSSQKSMMDSRNLNAIPPVNHPGLRKLFGDPESLIQTRQAHMHEVANIAEYVAAKRGANKGLAKVIGLAHDIGHTWNGHTGERILSSIGRLRNCGYIVHNAMGAYVFERENIIKGCIINQVKQMNPKVDEEEVREFMRYVIDGVVSHNGEGVIGRIIPKNKSSEEMAEEIRKCFTEKGFDKNIVPATIEGGIIRFADIIAYTRSDIQDAFRLKLKNGHTILEEYSDEYLSIIGTVLAKKNNYSKMLILEEKISLELDKLSRKIAELETSDNKEELYRVIREKNMVMKEYEVLRDIKIEYARKYVKGIGKDKRKTIIPSMLQNEFMKDLSETDIDKPYVTMSPLMRKTLFDLRELNAKRIVPYTKKRFEGKQLVEGVNKLVDIYSKTLIDSNIPYSLISPELKEEYHLKHTEDRRQQFINRLNEDNFESKMIAYYRRLYNNPDERCKLEEIYSNTIKALEEIIDYDIECALGNKEYDGELKELYEKEKIKPIRQMLKDMGKKAPCNLSKEEKKNLAQKLFKERIVNIEKMVADKMTIEYIGGMTDNTIIQCLISKHFLNNWQIAKGYDRPVEGSLKEDSGLRSLQEAFSKTSQMIRPDDVLDEDIRL